ncbi:hypothetical protein DFH28DRAFT_1155493 [Melampsora americana]|nr:hypothetical protein DFH28DRAFT_1155493 [Melampsora americana]
MSLPSPSSTHSPHHFIKSEKENCKLPTRNLLNVQPTSIKSLSPLTKARKTLPSPPTSIPSLTPPLVPSKRKSVVFNEERLGSAQSIPNHRSKAKASSGPSQSNQARQNNLPWQILNVLLSHPTTKQLSNGLDLPRSRPTSPLANRSSTKSLDRFYFHGRPSNEPIHHTQSPTLSASAPCKKASALNPSDMLIDEDEDALDSDGSDEAIAQELLPRNSTLNGHLRVRAYSLDANKLNVGREATSFSVSTTPLVDCTAANEEDGSVPRPILKKTYTQIRIAESLEQATRSNGRPKLAFEAHMFPGRSHLASNTASRALLSITGAAQGRMMNISHPLAQRTSENDGDQSDDGASSVEGNDGQTMSEPVPDAPTQEDCYIATARTSLFTLQASLLPPPNQMRLDPVSPLAALTSPQKQQVEPKDILPRAPIHNPRLEPLVIKTKMKKRARCLGPSTSRKTGARTSATTSRAPPATPRTPDRQTNKPNDVQSLPRAVITLREVEEAYLSLHFNLLALRQYWLEEGPLAEAEQAARLSKLFVDDLASSLMTCLVREVENLCRLQSNLPEPKSTGFNSDVGSDPSVGNATLDAPSDLSRLPPVSTSTAPPSAASKPTTQSSSPSEKVGISTNEIRRRVAEIETGQAGLRCIALFWSWPGCIANFAEAHTRRLISLLVDIPGSLILRRKKNLPSQTLGLNLLAPHSHHIIDAVSHTLYLSAGKSGDKGKRVLLLGLGALEQLIKQIPEHILPRISRVVDPLFAALVSPEASSLRHQGLRGLGALINCAKSDWNQGLRQSAVSWGSSENGQSERSPSEAQQLKKDDFREKISTYTFAHFTGQSSPRAWQVLNKQLSESFKVGDLGWVISSMATVIALLGKRIRRTDPPVTRCFKPHIQILLQKDGPVKQLAYQLWDYYILVMLIWSIENLQTKKSEEIWGLNKTQLSFFLQIFHNSSFWRPNLNLSSTSNSTMPAMSLNGQRLIEYDLFRPADHSRKPIPASLLGTSKTNSSSGTNIPPKIAPRPPAQVGKSVMIKPSTLHHSISAFLYGTIGCVQKHLSIPSPIPTIPIREVIGPQAWLESVAQSSQFRHLDIIWEEIIEPSIPNLLLSQINAHRLYASDIIVALFGGVNDTNEDGPSRSPVIWNLERFLHPVYHDPPFKAEQPSKIDLEKFSEGSDQNIPALDLLWICCRSSNVISLVIRSLKSIDSISNPNEFQWIYDHSNPTFQIIPIPILNIWTAYIQSLKRVQKSWQVIEARFNTSFLEVLSVLKERLFANDHHQGLSNRLRISRFRELYLVFKNEMGDELMKREIIESDDNQPKSALSDLMSFLVDYKNINLLKERSVEIESDLVEYSSLIRLILNDLIRTRKAFGSPKLLNSLGQEISSLGSNCSEEILKKSIGKVSRKTTSDLLKLIEAGVDWEELPIEVWMVKSIELSLLSFEKEDERDLVQMGSEIRFGEVLMDLVKFLGRCSDESFDRMMNGCSDGFIKYLEYHIESIGNGTEQLYQACLTRYSSYEGTIKGEMQEIFLKVFLIPFQSSFNLDHQSVLVNQVLLPFSKTKNGIKLLEGNQMIKSLFRTRVLMNLEEPDKDIDPLGLDFSRVEVEEQADLSMLSPTREPLQSGSNVQDEQQMEETDQRTPNKVKEAFTRSRSSSLSSIGSEFSKLEKTDVVSAMQVDQVENTEKGKGKVPTDIKKRRRSSRLSSGSTHSSINSECDQSSLEDSSTVDSIKPEKTIIKRDRILIRIKSNSFNPPSLSAVGGSGSSSSSSVVPVSRKEETEDQSNTQSHSPKKVGKRSRTISVTSNEGNNKAVEERDTRKRRRSNRRKQNDTSCSRSSDTSGVEGSEELAQEGPEVIDTEPLIEAPQAMVSEEADTNCADMIEATSKSSVECNREFDQNMSEAGDSAKSSFSKDIEKSSDGHAELVKGPNDGEANELEGNEHEGESLDKTTGGQSLEVSPAVREEENTSDSGNASSTKTSVDLNPVGMKKVIEVEDKGEKSGSQLRSPSFLSLSSMMNPYERGDSLLVGRSSSTSLAIGGEAEVKRPDDIQKNVPAQQAICQDPTAKEGVDNVHQGLDKPPLETISTTPGSAEEVELSHGPSSDGVHHSTTMAKDDKSSRSNCQSEDSSQLDIKPTAFSINYTLPESLEANPWAELAPLNTTRTQVDSTDRCEKSTDSVDTGTPTSSRSIRRSRPMLSPVVVIPYNPLRYSDARERASSQTTGQSSLQRNRDSGSQLVARTRSQARISISSEPQSKPLDTSQIDLPTSEQLDASKEECIEDESPSDDDAEEISTTRKHADDRSEGRMMSPAAKRSRRSDIGLDAYQPDQSSLARVTRFERPLTRSRSDRGLENQDEIRKGETSISKIDPDSLTVQTDRSRSLSSSRSSSGSRRSLRDRTVIQRTRSEVPQRPMVNQDDQPVVNEANEVMESTQDLRAQAENFSTEKLLKLTRVTASLVEERLSKK